jgi:ferrous iron transport protein A
MIASNSKIVPEKSFGDPLNAEGPLALTLDRLRAGQDGMIVAVDGEPALRRRLLEAGFVPDSPVHFLMATPFGDPLVFSLRGTHIALRQSEARHVRIRV